MKQPIARFMIAALLTASGAALACGDYVPTKGGQMNDDGGETAMELIQKEGEILIYLEDHGREIPSAGINAVLRLAKGGRAIAVNLLPSGGNLLKARLSSPIRVGDKLVAEVSFRDGDTATGTFVYGIGGDSARLSKPRQAKPIFR